MKKTLFPLVMLIFLKLNLFAQDNERTIMLLNELRVSDTDIYKKNYPAIYNWSMKASASMPVQRTAHVAESGLIYNCTFIKGDKNFGQYVATMNDMNIKIRKELKEVKENNDMTTQAVLRSAWVQVEKLNIKQAGYKIEDYDFRRIEIFTVPSNKIEEFEALVEKRNKADEAMNLRKYNYIVYKAIYGYPVNTYMVFLPGKSKLDFYKYQDERNAIRKNNKEYVEIEKKRTQLKTTLRIDHLSRIQH